MLMAGAPPAAHRGIRFSEFSVVRIVIAAIAVVVPVALFMNLVQLLLTKPARQVWPDIIAKSFQERIWDAGKVGD